MFSRALGNINPCLRPHRIYNRYIGEFLYTNCRKCVRCRSSYASSWANRIDSECSFHRYSLFLTLTYDNDHLPYYSPLFNIDGSRTDVWCSNRGCDNGKFVSSEIARPIPPVGMEDTVCFAYPCKKDVQDFFKRLRSKIDYKLKPRGNEYRIRYFICSEYGPNTFRPHYHAILWYDSEILHNELNVLIRETWKNGNTDFSLVNSSASQYVAKYVNGDCDLPSFLRTEFTSTFHLASKHPCIGYGKDDEEALYENVINGTYGRNCLNKSTNEFEFVCPPRSLENRILPKCKGYRRISHSERVRIYALAYDYEQKGLDYKSLLPFEFDYAAYPHVDIHASLMCLDFCKRYNWTPEMFVCALEDYYYRKDMYLLKTQYEYQVSYVDSGNPVCHLVDFDLDLMRKLPRRREVFLCSPWRSIMSTYGLDSSVLYDADGNLNGWLFYHVRQYGSHFYSENVARYQKIHNDSLKNKKLNEILNKYMFV